MGAERGVCELGDIRVKLNRKEASLTEDTPTTYRPGEYELPFSFRLPESLPSSFEMKDRRLVELGAMESSIAYKVRATIRIDGALHPYIEGSRPFIVQRPPLDNPMRPLERSSSEQIRVFRVFSRGRCTLSASLDHNEVSAGDTVTVFTSVENQTSKDMTGISVQLVEDLAVDVPFRTQKRGSTVLQPQPSRRDRARRSRPVRSAHDFDHGAGGRHQVQAADPYLDRLPPCWLQGLRLRQPDLRPRHDVQRRVRHHVLVVIPQGLADLGPGHRHDWEHVVMWVDDISLDSPSIVAVSPSAHSGYNIYYPPESDTIDGYSAKVDYSSSWLVINHALDSTSDTGETQDLIMWDQLTDAARTALENTDFGDANVPMKDANFETKLGNTYYA
ncbi:hypothetical protein ON010_g2659 [Phytophthora cinnamomi]|nr:hypothetical protein ON010_g2659 [Phytophthora cinnamomi]